MKAIYRVMADDSRLYIPKAVREGAGVESGDVLELRAGKGKITLIKAKIVQADPPTVEDILELLEAVPKAKLFEATAILMDVLNGGGTDHER